MTVRPESVNLHYYGCTEVVLAAAVFKPCWHEINGDAIILAKECPEPYNEHIKDIHIVLVARNLEFTKASKLGYQALRALAPVHDQLFRFHR
jgi:hypothetical protein